MRSGRLVALLALTAMAPAPALASAADTWKTYTNVRFAYHLCYPASLLTPQPEAPNGDGRVFAGADGTKLSVWGSNALDRTLASDLDDNIADGDRVTYKVVKPTWYVFSALRGSRIVYHRTQLAEGVLKTFELDYPASAAARWNPVVARLSACFKSLS